MKKRTFFYLIFLGIILFLLIPFLVITSIPTLHALAFLIHQDGGWYITLIVGTIAYSIWLVVGAVKWEEKQTEVKQLWVILIVAVFAIAAALTYTKNAAVDDPNISFRYKAFITQKGWDK